ncbi:MAG TPA: PEP/pyruvate-binding domain-containing protein [Steroidobacteraceae bacterium]|nr:PEP/pyruvate-binding domain-containing protein [Steroidobacteraceae bacterium]
MRWILHPSDLDCALESCAGGKGASLARLAGLGAQVPDFFVIRAAAHQQMRTEPTEEFVAELTGALAGIGSSGGVSVRSSALGEDAADSSFAGIYHTSLDVHGLDAVLGAVRRCWQSYEEPVAVDYRNRRGSSPDGAMAVVVQRMVHGDWSGVCFTAHPVKLALSEGLINAAPGLGEALVSGQVNPEEITIDSQTGRVLEHRGVHGEPFPPAGIHQVWSTCSELAARLRFPQDIEWAWRAGQLYILQSRPITTIADVYYSRLIEPWRADPSARPDSPDRLWSRMLADETWVSPISPLFYNVHNSTPGRVGFFRSHGDKSALPPDMFKYHQATAYADTAVISRMYEYQPRLARIQGIVNFLPPSLQPGFRRAPWRWRGRLRRVLSYELFNRRMRSLTNNHKYVAAQWPAYVEKSNAWLDMDLDKLSLQDLRAHQAAVQKEMMSVGPPCAIAVLSHASDLHLLLTGLLGRWLGHLGCSGESLYARISSGLDDSETLRENETLWEIAQSIRALGDAAVRSAASDNWLAFAQLARRLAGGQAVVERFERFWRAHRHLGSSYKDLIWPRWGDDIDLCFSMLKGYVASQAGRPCDIHARSAASRVAAQRELLGALRGPWARVRRWLLRRLFRYNELYMAIRDNHRYYVDRNWYEVRRIYRSFGSRLVEAGVLQFRNDVFFLGTLEVDSALAGELASNEASARIAVRRKVWETTLRRQGPKFLRGWNAVEESEAAGEGAATWQLQGIAASPGSAIGAARVVYEVSALPSVKDGEILVTRQTDPSWTTVFGRISGLVLETGGVLSHGTSLCREYGLPCVTAVERATIRIPDGSRIELLGSAGLIRILDGT